MSHNVQLNVSIDKKGSRPDWGGQMHTFVRPPPLGARGIMFSGCPSVRPNIEIPPFHLYMGPLVHPTNRERFAACPSVRLSVRPERFPDIYRRTHAGNGLKFCMLMYIAHLQNWLEYGHGLLIFLLLAPFWLGETGQIWGFRAFPKERIEGMAYIFTVCWFSFFWSTILTWWNGSNLGFLRIFQGSMEGMAWNFACWVIVATFRTV